MSKKQRKRRNRPVTPPRPRFTVGTSVRVKAGTKDPDYVDIPLGGWAGKVLDVDHRGGTRSYLIEWDRHTLEEMHPIYRKRCDRDDLEVERAWLDEDDLEPSNGAVVPMEQPTQIVTRALRPRDQDDRIRAIFGLTSDDPLPTVSAEHLRRYQRHLATHLAFPFQARYRVDDCAFEDRSYLVSVLGLLDPDDCDQEDGLLCEATREGESAQLPLTEVEATINLHNRGLLEDYAYWFINWPADNLAGDPAATAGTDEPSPSTPTFGQVILTASVVGGFYGATLGTALAAIEGAATAAKIGAVSVGLPGGFLAGLLGRLFANLTGARQVRWLSVFLGLGVGALAGAMLGALVTTFQGAVLGGLTGAILASLLGPRLARPARPLLWTVAGALFGMAIQAWRVDGDEAWAGAWQGGLIGMVAAPILFIITGTVFVRVTTERR
jgi:hypothetical protein